MSEKPEPKPETSDRVRLERTVRPLGHAPDCDSLRTCKGKIVHTIIPCSCAPYFVELDDAWRIVKPGGKEYLDRAWETKAEAQDFCDWLNDAYEAGREAR